jgi:hypothetical protein
MATVTDPRNPVQSRRAARPATGTARWVTRPGAGHLGGVLAINGTRYEVLPIFDGAALAGYRLLKPGTVTMYDLPADLARLVAAWPDLPAPIRAAVLALLDAAR